MPARIHGAASPEPALSLEAMIPKRFGDWREKHFEHVVNPQERELLDKLYSDTLSRTYVNSSGYMIMLSLAHGRDQRGDLAAHMPEICYPANGFTLHRTESGQLPTPFGEIPVRRLFTSRGAREEPVTYWFTFGAEPISLDQAERAIAEKAGRAAVCVHRSNSRWTTLPSLLHRPRSGSSKPIAGSVRQRPTSRLVAPGAQAPKRSGRFVNAMTTSRFLVFVTLLALVLTACGRKEDAKVATQVAARVNSTEITVHQINHALGSQPRAHARECIPGKARNLRRTYQSGAGQATSDP